MLFFQVSWVCRVCQKKQEMLTKTGNWFGSITAPGEKTETNDSDSLGSDFRAIPTEEDKRAMRRQAGSLQRSDSARSSGRRGKGKDGERNRFRRPSVSDEEIDESPAGSPAYLSDDELYRPDENKVRRKVVKFKGHDELDHAPQGRHPGTVQNRSGPLNQGPGRGLAVPGQGPGIRPGHPQPQGLGVRQGGIPGGLPGRGQQSNFPPQQQGSSFTPVGHPGTSPSSRPPFPGPQQQGPRGGMAPNQPRPGFGMRGPPGPQQQRIQGPPQNVGGYGRGGPPGSQPGAPQQGQPGQPGQTGFGRGGSPGPQPITQYNLGPRPGAYGPTGPRPPGGFPANHVGGPQQAPGSPRPGDCMGTHQGPRVSGPQGMPQMGPRFGPGGQPRHSMPPDQQGGQQQHPGQIGLPRQGQAPPGQIGSSRQGQVPPGQLGLSRDGQVPPGQLSSPRQGQVPGQFGTQRDGQIPGQLGTPRQGAQLDQHPRGQLGSPRSGPPMEQVKAPVPIGSPRLGAPRNQLGAPQQAPFSEKGRGQVDTSVDQSRGRSGPPSQEPGQDHPRGPFSNQPGSPVNNPRGQFGTSQQAPAMDQGRPRLGSAEKGPMGDQPGRQQVPDSRNGYSPETQSTSADRLALTHNG